MRDVVIRIRDDLDPRELADETISFSYRNTAYEIDLTEAHVLEFDLLMEPYLKGARKVETEKLKPRKNNPPYRKEPAHQQRNRIREWARETGWVVKPGGPVAKVIIDAYEQTHPDDPILPGTRTKVKRKATPLRAEDGAERTVDEILNGHQRAADAIRADAAETGRWSFSREERDKVRAWAQQQGLDQAPTGQIKSEVAVAYLAEKSRNRG